MRIDVQLSGFGLKLWSDEARTEVANAVRDELHSWYANLPEDWFDNPEPFPDGTPRHAGKRTFMRPLSTAWRAELTAEGFALTFAHTRDGGPWGLHLQQYGNDDIRPVKKKALTIPVTADARGLSVRAFQAKTGRNLFVVKGEAAKKNPDVIGSLVWEDPAGALHAAYVLRKRSQVPPLKERRGHDAIPSEQQMLEWTRDAYTTYLTYMLEF